ncbi:phosphodiester glycosidase family protein [Roseofilum casamattae]|uniref:Phosphodiester glycosidase family protein n=1 Tax=Roseofilum casamattae BLCC-M143 TaxID=3022442 RepID=A0ABT7BUG7_9CYAN|nr:phosphodiester glycosidase family protein [Roseofilum casamattae]MDJ1182422.1 phosphodiester glycosidase family protein [Roseofilum casamattae BLCC-M143]
MNWFSLQFLNNKAWQKLGLLVISLILLVPGTVYGILLLKRPARTPEARELFPGVYYTRAIASQPHPLIIHQVTIDLTSEHIEIVTTPGNPTPDGLDIDARKTSTFVREFDLQLAINGSFFHPFDVKHPGNYYPREGERVNVLGQAISNGEEYSPVNSGWNVLCFSADKTARIPGGSACPENTEHAIPGGAILFWEGKPVNLGKGSFYARRYPRTAVGVNASETELILLLVDGRQPFYSEGASLQELQSIFAEKNVETALNLDGGGSTTLVIADPDIRILNAPFHTRIPLRERPVANHLGFRIEAK